MQAVTRPAGRAITSLQFSTVLNNVFGIEKPWRLSRVGLAISGGVDSMALLFMWHRYLKQEGVKASSASSVFVLDHVARPNSAAETQQIAQNIKQLTNVDAKILTLDWEGRDPQSLSNFESQARRLRYQALGRACHQEGISKLLVAHHGDDAAETVLRRIATRHFGEHLHGISPVAQIPECTGQHGIYESGSPVPLGQAGYAQPWCYESGGVSLLRPLLDFSKDDIIATCNINEVAWVEDPTNHDPRFTYRNATRYVLNSGKLPTALSADKLQSLMSNVRANQAETQDLRDKYLSKCVVLSLDLRCGELEVFLPRFKDVFPTLSASDAFATKYDICCSVVAYLRDIVAPNEGAPKGQLGSVVNAMFPGEFPELAALTLDREVPRYTLAMCLMEPLDLKREIKKATTRRKNTQAKGPKKYTTAEKRGLSLWRFSRQPSEPPMKNPAVLIMSGIIQEVDQDKSTVTDAGMVTNEEIEEIDAVAPQSSYTWWNPEPVVQEQNQFFLWDSRYWIRVSLHDLEHGVEIRMPNVKALEEMSNTFQNAGEGEKGPRVWAELLLWESRRMRGKPQSIPAIVAPPGLPSVAAGTILALPTYNLVLPQYRGRIKWEFRYKRIDIGALNLRPGPINSLLHGAFTPRPQLSAEL